MNNFYGSNRDGIVFLESVSRHSEAGKVSLFSVFGLKYMYTLCLERIEVEEPLKSYSQMNTCTGVYYTIIER